MRKKLAAFGALAILTLTFPGLYAGSGAKNLPVMQDTEQGQVLVLPDAVDAAMQTDFPGYKIPAKTDFNPEMLSYYYSRLVGIHPAVAWGDFNGDKRLDYALLLVTGQSSWGPLVELVVLNGEAKKGTFTSYRLGEIYNFKDDYVSFDDGKLIKGRFKKGAWFLNWNPKTKTYDVSKS